MRGTLFIGNNHIHLQSVHSTNQYLQELLQENDVVEGTAVTAGFQTKGRGQVGRFWESNADENLLSSILLKPKSLQVSDQFDLSIATALAVSDFVKGYLPAEMHEKVKVKWPNDVFVGDQKVAGILIQTVLAGKLIEQAIVGIGVNINQTSFPEFLINPTSLALLRGETIQLAVAIEKLFHSLESRYLRLRGGGTKYLRLDYLSRMYKFEEEAQFTDSKGEVFSGQISGISPTGQLQILSNGTLHTFNFHEVRMVI